MDVNALRSLRNVWKTCSKRNITLLLSSVQEQPLRMMKKAGFDKEVGADNFCDNIDTALSRAAFLVKDEEKAVS